MSQLNDPEVLRAILYSLPMGLYVVNRDHKVLFWNDGIERLTGFHSQDIVGRLWNETATAPANQNDALAARQAQSTTQRLADPGAIIESTLREGKPVVADISLVHKSGHRLRLRMHSVPVRDTSGTIIGAAQSFEEPQNVSDWDERHSKLRAAGCLDPDTGLLNQKFIEFHLRESLAGFNEHKLPFSIVCVQVDQLEHLRRRYGAAAMALVQRAVAKTLETSLRPTDFIGRLGQQQFLAVLPECAAGEINFVTDRLAEMVAGTEIRWWGDEISVTASFGGAAVLEGDTTESMLDRARQELKSNLDSGNGPAAKAG